MTENADIEKCKYSGFGIGFDRSFSFPGAGLVRNVISFGVDMSSSMKIGKGKLPTQGSEHTLSAEKMHLINFTEHNKTFCLSLHYNGVNSYLFVNVKEIHKFRAKDYEIATIPLCLGNVS